MSAVPPTLSPSLSHGSSDDSGDSGRSCSTRYQSDNRQCMSIFIIPFAIVGLGCGVIAGNIVHPETILASALHKTALSLPPPSV